jgi:hypothetical protein
VPLFLDSSDRRLLIFGAAFLVVISLLAAAVTPPEANDESGIPSTYSTASGGARAAYTLLEKLGYEVHRWEQSPIELPSDPEGHLLVLAQPVFPASAAEKQAIHRFVHAGGTVLAIGSSAAALVPEGSTAEYETEDFAWKSFPAVQPASLTRGAERIKMAPPSRWDTKLGSHQAMYAEGGNAVVVRYPTGKGSVIWWAAATPLTNAGLPLESNLQLFLNCVGSPEEYSILWDEYFHGQRRSLRSFLAQTPAPWAFAQLCLVAALILITFSRRSGPVHIPDSESRLSPLEFVETLGELYRRAQAGSAAVSVSYAHFRMLLARRLGLPVNTPVEQLHQAARERLGWTKPGFYEALRAADRGSRNPQVGNEEALRIVQALEHYTELLQLAKPDREGASWRNR